MSFSALEREIASFRQQIKTVTELAQQLQSFSQIIPSSSSSLTLELPPVSLKPIVALPPASRLYLYITMQEEA